MRQSAQTSIVLRREHRATAALCSLAALEAHCMAGHGTMPLPSRASRAAAGCNRPATVASGAFLPYCGAAVASEGPPPMIISEAVFAPRPPPSLTLSRPSSHNLGPGGRGSAELCMEQQKALARIADYPRRVERLKRLWISANSSPPSTPMQGQRTRSHSRLARAGAVAVGVSAQRRPLLRGSHSRGGAGFVGGPLTAQQISELMTRELTPEDYELLLLLDEGVKKAPTLSSGAAAALPRPSGTAWVDEECRVCLCALEEGEDVRELPCGHWYHGPCIERWLTASRCSCPICGAVVSEGS